MIGKIKKFFSKKGKDANALAKHEQLKNVAIFCVVLGVCFLFYYFSSQEDTSIAKEEPTFDGALDRSFTGLSDEALFEKQQHQIDAIQDLMAKEQKKKETPSAEKEMLTLVKTLENKLVALEIENKSMHEELKNVFIKQSEASLKPVARPPSREEIQAKELEQINAERERFTHAGLETIRFSHRRKFFEEERTSENYVWAGSFVEGYLLSGAKGDAGINGSKNMGTAIIRLDSDGIMPNDKRSYLNGCFVVVSTYGDLSEDSVVMHLETLSCASKKLNFEKQVYGSVFDLDAMQDLRGVPILNTKPLLTYSAAAGILSGIGQGLSNYGSAQSINPQTGSITTYSTAANLAQSAAGGGISNPANRVSDYIMKIADIYHPVVIARAGRRVSVMFTKGFWIDKKHQHVESGITLDTSENAEGTQSTASEYQLQEIAGNKEVTPESDDKTAQEFLKESDLDFKEVQEGGQSRG